MTGPAMDEKTSPTKDVVASGTVENISMGGYDSYGLVKSTFDDLSIPRTLWVFRRVTLVALAIYTGYVCEGFEVRGQHLNEYTWRFN